MSKYGPSEIKKTHIIFDVYRNTIRAVVLKNNVLVETITGLDAVNDLIEQVYNESSLDIGELVRRNILSFNVASLEEKNYDIDRTTFKLYKKDKSSSKTTGSSKTRSTSSSSSSSSTKTTSSSSSSSSTKTTSSASSSSDDDSKENKGISGLRILAASLIGALVLSSGVILCNAKNPEVVEKKDNNKSKQSDGIDGKGFETTQSLPTDAELINRMAKNTPKPTAVPTATPTPRPTARPTAVPAPSYYDMETLIQMVNDICFNYEQGKLEDLVEVSEKETIAVINKMRKSVLNGTCSPERFMDCIIAYGFGNKSTFNGIQVKPYGTISTFSHYVIMACAESIVQLCPDYQTVFENDYYDYSILVDSYDYMIDYDYRSLTGRLNQK